MIWRQEDKKPAARVNLVLDFLDDQSDNSDNPLVLTPPVSDNDESQDNPSEQLEGKEIEKIESFLNEKKLDAVSRKP